MSVQAWVLWGFVATVVLTSIMSGSQAAGITRMNIPFILGTLFTPNRDRAKIIGFLLHFVNGWILSLVYVAAFHAWGSATWWRGAAIGVVHAAFVLLAATPLIPSFHPRMATEQHGPEPPRLLEPPGFLALHYGLRTPLSVLIAHIVYGAILGAFYVV
jgi:uncharacterized membrane protein YagU involved in acid resistance